MGCNLSKSKYTRGAQCPKMLWMAEYMPEQFDESVMNESVLKNGNEVGDLAMGYFGDFTEVAFDPDDPQRFEKAKVRTQELLAAQTPVICEATFDYDGNYCMADILRRRQDGTFDLVEVKSSTSCKDIYLHDMTYQAWVLTQCGLELASVNLMHVNNQYVRKGELDLHEYFALEDHTEDVRAMMDEVPERVAELKALMAQDAEPVCGIGLQCFNPYECGYRQWCWREMPTPNAFDIGRLSKAKAFALHDEGADSFEQILKSPSAFNQLNKKQQTQVASYVEEWPAQIDCAAVAEFLDTLTFPLYFLDFETFQPAIPPFDDARPYQQIPSQYSLHVLRAADAELEHYEFLAEAGTDPRRSVAEHLVADIPEGVCTLAYNMSFEKGRIKEMAELFPDLADHLLAINAGMKDLMIPFRDGACYDRAMGGSFSIKYVLPALFPDDPELDYHALEGVHNGGEAMAVFADLVNMESEQAEHMRERLLRYCELDTYAMVKIWQKLVEVSG